MVYKISTRCTHDERLVDVDLEAGDLREVCSRCEIHEVHVVKDLIAVEAAKDENPAVCLQRGVVSASRWWSSGDWPRFKVEGDYDDR